MTQNAAALEHRMKYHNFLREHASLSAAKKGLKPIAWGITLVWLFFGVGPGAVLGNDIFGAPDAGIDGWTFGMPQTTRFVARDVDAHHKERTRCENTGPRSASGCGIEAREIALDDRIRQRHDSAVVEQASTRRGIAVADGEA